MAADTPEAATDASNPYSVISDRNIFHLNPPPPPVAPELAKPLDLPKVMLTGFVGKGNSMRVLLAIPPAKDSKEGIAYLSLAPGDRDHDVQLVKIHLDKEEVEIMNSGTAQTLSAKSNSYASMAAAAAAPRDGGGRPDGKSGIHRPMIPGFNPPGPAVPTGEPAFPTAGRQGGSPVIAGGGNYGGSGAIVSGGYSGGQATGYNTGQTTGTVTGDGGVGSQIANSLFNPQTPRTQIPQRANTPLVPVENQGATMVIQKATAPTVFPPLPPNLEEELQQAQGGGGSGE